MKNKHFLILSGVLAVAPMMAEEVSIGSPDGNLTVKVTDAGGPTYSISLDGIPMLQTSPLGLLTNYADYGQGMMLVKHQTDTIRDSYVLRTIKQSHVDYVATRSICTFRATDGRHFDVEFRVADHDVAFRYLLPKVGETGSVRVMQEYTGFTLPDGATHFLTPQSDAMIGWKRSKPSYEEFYDYDAPLDKPSQFGHGYTFPCLFRLGENGWLQISETGVDSRYCGSHLSEYAGNGRYHIAFPMPEENNGNGTIEPAFALPGATPWRTITLGRTLQPLVESTVTWDVVEPRYQSTQTHHYGKSTWSWIVWQDNSMNYDDQVTFINLAAELDYDYTLVDANWDKELGYEKVEELIRYARSKGVDIFLWYSSSGYWNDIVQSPINIMCDPIARKREMRWLKEQGVKGIKVDFFAGDKQETIRLYEAILSDADDYGLMVIFHGCTLPRGWERMYPNYVGSEAVLASENLIFGQIHCDIEAQSAALHPFCRNAVGCMEYGGTVLNRRMHKSNSRGNIRRTTDVFQLATAVLFQNPIQNFALTPNNLTESPRACIDFMRSVPTTWDEVRFIDGYPGRYVILARRHGDTWYVAGVNATDETIRLDLDLAALGVEQALLYDGGNEARATWVEPNRKGLLKIAVQPQDGVVVVGQ